MKQINIKLDDELLAQTRYEAKRRRMSVTALIRFLLLTNMGKPN
jgi:Arc/MetJ family transcription regulator